METRAIGLLVAGAVVVGGAIFILARPPADDVSTNEAASGQAGSSDDDRGLGVQAKGKGDKPTPAAGTRIPAQDPPEPTVPFDEAMKTFDDALEEIEDKAAAGKVDGDTWVDLYTNSNKALDDLRPHYDPRDDDEVKKLTEQTTRLSEALGKLEQM